MIPASQPQIPYCRISCITSILPYTWIQDTHGPLPRLATGWWIKPVLHGLTHQPEASVEDVVHVYLVIQV